MIKRVLPRSVVSGLAKIEWVGPRLLFRLHGRGWGFETCTWQDLVARVVAERPRHLSIDVYDTCLIRVLAGDQPIELAIKHRYASDPDLPSTAEIAADLEQEFCQPVPGAVAALKAIRDIAPNVTFVSDTDRSSELLASMLRWHGMFVDGDRLVASCEAGATKSKGDLYTEVWSAEEINEGVWHLGNSIWADGVMAAKSGLHPVHLDEADVNRYESTMAQVPESEGPAIAAAARTARLGIDADHRLGKLSTPQAEAQTLGAGLGQALVAFDLWLADQVTNERIAHLAFLARDGELPMRIAQILPADYWPGVSMAYLHCSRMVWGLASASAVGLEPWLRAGTKDDSAFLHTQRHDVPLSSLLTRIGMTNEDLASLGTDVAKRLQAVRSGQPLPVEAVEAWDELLLDTRVGEMILERSEQRRLLLIDYVRGEGLLESRLGMVDVGWSGRLAWHISNVLTSAGAQEPVHFHFGGTGVIPEVDEAIDIRRFAFDGSESHFFASSPVSCVETLTASGKPRVIDYRRNSDGEVQPVLGQAGFESDGDRADLWAGALRTAANMPSRKKLDEWGVQPTHLGEQVRALLALWWNTPTKAEAESIARLVFEHDEAGTAMRQLATPYSWGELLKRTSSMRAWRQGSEALTGRPLRQIVRSARLVRSRFESRR